MFGSTRESVKDSVKRGLIRADLEVRRGSAFRQLASFISSQGVRVILDVGANRGQYARQIRTAGFRGTIHSYEPLSDAYQGMLEAAQKDPQWHCHMLALGAEPGEATLNVAGNSYSSSLRSTLESHLDAAPNSRTVTTQEVPVQTLSSQIGRLRLEPESTFLKIDTQGFEMDVLSGAGANVNSFFGMQVEMSLIPLYQGQALFDDIHQFLSSHEYELWRIQPGFSDRHGRMLQCDGIYFRAGDL